jgi:hypothetical protein
MFAHDKQALDVSALNDEFACIASPTNDVRRFINDLPSPLPPNGTFDYPSPLDRPFRGGELSITSTSDITPAIIANGVPIQLKKNAVLRHRMRMAESQMCLIHCEVLQSTINILERRPWEQHSKAEAKVHHCYRKIQKLADKAHLLAEATSNHDLQARSNYWRGRGCGGLRDWGAAISHFGAAIMLDVPQGGLKNGSRRPRGLLPNERGDVDLLLQSVTQRYKEWIQEEEEARKAMHGEEASPSPIENTHREELKGPPWRPHQDRMVHLAKQQCETQGHSERLQSQLRSGEYAGTLFSDEDVAAVDERLNVHDGRQEIRRSINADEWLYVLHGDQTTKKRAASTNHKSAIDRSPLSIFQDHHRNESSLFSSFVSPTNSPNQHLSGTPTDIDNAMDLASYESGTPSLVGSGRSPSSGEQTKSSSLPAGYLQGRRNAKLPPISTSAIQKDDRLGEAVLGLISPADSTRQESV